MALAIHPAKIDHLLSIHRLCFSCSLFLTEFGSELFIYIHTAQHNRCHKLSRDDWIHLGGCLWVTCKISAIIQKNIWAPTELGSNTNFLWIPTGCLYNTTKPLVSFPFPSYRKLKVTPQTDEDLKNVIIALWDRRTCVLEGDFCPFWLILHRWTYNAESPLGPSSLQHQVTTFTSTFKCLYFPFFQELWVESWIHQRIPCLFLKISQSDASCTLLSWPVCTTTQLVLFFLFQNSWCTLGGVDEDSHDEHAAVPV